MFKSPRMAKNLVFPLIIILILTSCKGNNIQIKGKVNSPIAGKYIFLEELVSDMLIPVDSFMIKTDGIFKFDVNIEHPAFYLLKFDNQNFLTMLLEPDVNVEIEANADNLNYPTSLVGTPGTEQMVIYNEKLQETIDNLSQLSTIYEANIGSRNLYAVMDSLDSLAGKYMNDMNLFTKEYIDHNIPSLVCLPALYQQVAPGEYVLHPERDIEYYEKVDSALFSLYPDYDPVTTLHRQVQEVVAQFAAMKEYSPEAVIGTSVPDITLPNPEGEIIPLSSLKGNVVLLDFWASWCPPCRAESPNLVKAYNLYHDKGFEIFQVSLDKTREAWLRGIEQDKLERWIHVSDVNYWNSVVVSAYNLEAIPANYLLDRDGKVINMNLRGEDLLNVLEQYFN